MGGDAAVVNRAYKPVSEKVVVDQTPVAYGAVQNFDFRVRR